MLFIFLSFWLLMINLLIFLFSLTFLSNFSTDDVLFSFPCLNIKLFSFLPQGQMVSRAFYLLIHQEAGAEEGE